MRKYNFISIFFYIIMLIYVLGATYMIFGYFSGELMPTEIPTDWWTALGIVVTLTIAILIMNFIREKDYLEIQNEISDFKKEIENAKQLSSLSTILLDIATDENSNSEKWNKNYKNIEKLYKIGFIKDIELYRISLEAWKQDEIFFAFKLRKLAYEFKPTHLPNKLYLLSILPYIDVEKVKSDNGIRRLYNESEFFMNEIGFVKNKDGKLDFATTNFFKKFHNIIKGITISHSNECFAYALTGRYLFMKGQYDESRYFFKLAIEKTGKPGKRWHYRHLLQLDLANNDFHSLKENLEKAKNIPDWTTDFKYIAFQELIENILNIKNGNSIIKPNSLSLIKGINLSKYERFTMWNFSSIIDSLELEQTKIEVIQELYLKFYAFFGSDDDRLSAINVELEKSKHITI